MVKKGMVVMDKHVDIWKSLGSIRPAGQQCEVVYMSCELTRFSRKMPSRTVSSVLPVAVVS